ncbi:hypothetical protein [Clostridium sp.]
MGTILYGSIFHYVEPVEDNIDRCYDISNLLYVDTNTHAIIHIAYNRSDKDKKDMQDMLFELIKRNRWKLMDIINLISFLFVHFY